MSHNSVNGFSSATQQEKKLEEVHVHKEAASQTSPPSSVCPPSTVKSPRTNTTSSTTNANTMPVVMIQVRYCFQSFLDCFSNHLPDIIEVHNLTFKKTPEIKISDSFVLYESGEEQIQLVLTVMESWRLLSKVSTCFPCLMITIPSLPNH